MSQQRLDPDELASLEEQQRFLGRSLDDLDREYAAGDLDEHDYETLKSDYRDRAAAVARTIEGGRARFAAARRTRSVSGVVAVTGAVVILAIAAGFLVAQAMGRRDSGQTLTGGVDASTDPPAQGVSGGPLAACLTLDGQRRALDALKCYDRIIKKQPENGRALAYRGWLVARANLPYNALKYLERAVRASPRLVDAHAFHAIVLARVCRAERAKAALDAVASLEPPEQVDQLLESVRSDVEAQRAGTRQCRPPPTTSTTTK